MDIITTSLEALIQRATNANNPGPDTAAIDAFCGLVDREPVCASVAAKLVSERVHSPHEWEALQALLVLEACMKRCSIFLSEVGKFRFLNELIKLVSPKYEAARTPEAVKKRVLELMKLWTVEYPKEGKIREAYDMLKKQGVVPVENITPLRDTRSKTQSSILQDEEKSQLLQKLLQSKNPEDLQAANKLIKAMVKEDERRLEEKWRSTVELDTVVNNCRLLREMLDSYNPNSSSSQDLDLIKELYSACQNFRPVIFKLANNADPAFCSNVLLANDELGEVFTKYESLIGSSKETPKTVAQPPTSENVSSLLDLTPSTSIPPPVESATEQLSHLGLNLTPSPLPSSSSSAINSNPNYLDSLDEIFRLPPASVNSSSSPQLISLSSSSVTSKTETTKPSRNRGLEELDMMLKESLSGAPAPPKQNKKLPLNQILPGERPVEPKLETDIPLTAEVEKTSLERDLLLDDALLFSDPEVEKKPPTPSPPAPASAPAVETQEKELAVLPLGDITVTLDSIKPSIVEPYHALDVSGISVILHLAKDRPRPDVSVFVVTTTSQSSFPVTNFLFQPIVPKPCRLKLLPPSGTCLPAHKPFLPPSALTQLMLIASPTKDPITLKYVISYVSDDETVNEMGEISKLLLEEP